MAGAPKGNKNAARGKIWSDAIIRALAKRSRVTAREAIDDLAEKLLEQCDEGNMIALKEVGDRLEGKPAQTLLGDSDNPLELITRIELVTPNVDSKD